MSLGLGRNAKKILLLSALSFLSTLIGFLLLQVVGSFITSFSIWTLTQSQKIPPEFPFFYIPEFIIIISALLVLSTIYVLILKKLRILSIK